VVPGIDPTGIPTAQCPNCGDMWMNVPVFFDPDTYEVAAWGTEASCYACDTPITAPTPIDHPDYGTLDI